MSLPIQLSPSLITIPERDKIELQTDTSFFADEKRIISCCEPLKLKEKTKIIVELGEHILLNAAQGAAGGFVGGALVTGPVFGVIGSLFGGLPGFVGGYKLGTTLSTVAELIDGGMKGIKEFEIEFMSSDRYKNWADEARKIDVYPIYERIIKNDPRFDTFICPLSMDLICIPVRAPDGRVYEQASITKWIRQKEEQIKLARESEGTQEKIDAKINAIKETISPIRARVESFSVQDLRYFPEYFKRLDSLVKRKTEEIEDGEIKRVFKEAMQAIQASQREDQKQIIKLKIAEITLYVLNNNLDQKISINIIRKFNEEIKEIEKEEELAKTQV